MTSPQNASPAQSAGQSDPLAGSAPQDDARPQSGSAQVDPSQAAADRGAGSPSNIIAGVDYPARTKSFTRRGRPLHASTQRTWDEHAPSYVIDVVRDGGYTTVDPSFRVDLEAEFGRRAPLIIEVGMGNGEQIVDYAAKHPEVDLLGVEVYRQGIAKAISRAASAGVDNVRFMEVDAAQALPIMLPAKCATQVWTFFPDPWRKSRHHKRRLVNDAFAGTIARLLVDGGVWRLATDWQNYAWQMRDVVEASRFFENVYEGERPDPEDPHPGRGGFAPRFEDRVLTHFEQRGQKAGRGAYDIVGRRLARDIAPDLDGGDNAKGES